MKATVLAVLLATCGVAHADFLNGNGLLAMMQSDNIMEQQTAIGYVEGLHDAYNGMPQYFCTPQGVNGIQLRDVVKKGLEQRPETRELLAAILVAQILYRTWPCKKQ